MVTTARPLRVDPGDQWEHALVQLAAVADADRQEAIRRFRQDFQLAEREWIIVIVVVVVVIGGGSGGGGGGIRQFKIDSAAERVVDVGQFVIVIGEFTDRIDDDIVAVRWWQIRSTFGVQSGGEAIGFVEGDVSLEIAEFDCDVLLVGGVEDDESLLENVVEARVVRVVAQFPDVAPRFRVEGQSRLR